MKNKNSIEGELLLFEDMTSAVSSYAGLLKKAIELIALFEIEETERERIKHQYKLQSEALASEIRKFELVITADNERRKRFIEASNEAIISLIENEQYELSNMFHERIARSFEGSPLQALIDYRKNYASLGYLDIKHKT
jgi:hypothetical protein